MNFLATKVLFLLTCHPHAYDAYHVALDRGLAMTARMIKDEYGLDSKYLESQREWKLQTAI